MSTGLEGKLAIVTGAGQGIGAAIALLLAKRGAKVVSTDVGGDSAARTADAFRPMSGDAWSFPLDVRDRPACEALAKTVTDEIGVVDILVNNAGILRSRPIAATDAREAWDETIDVNLTGAYNMILAFQAALRASRGVVLNVSSMFGFLGGANLSAYSATKGAIIQLTRSLAVELAPDGIRVNAIAPGVIDTPLSKPVMDDEVRLARVLSRIPLKRLGSAEEVAEPAVFLCSPAARYVTGVVLPVDGGFIIT